MRILKTASEAIHTISCISCKRATQNLIPRNLDWLNVFGLASGFRVFRVFRVRNLNTILTLFFFFSASNQGFHSLARETNRSQI